MSSHMCGDREGEWGGGGEGRVGGGEGCANLRQRLAGPENLHQLSYPHPTPPHPTPPQQAKERKGPTKTKQHAVMSWERQLEFE